MNPMIHHATRAALIPLAWAWLSLPGLSQEVPATAAGLEKAAVSGKATVSDSVQLVFDPAPGVALHKVWLHDHELLSEPMINLHGSEVQVTPTRMRVQTKHELDVTDHYRVVENGRPTVLRRRYDTTSRIARVSFRRGNERWRGPGPFTQESPLMNGVGVVFEWYEDSGYGRHFDAVEKEEWVLDGLTAELDLVQLLPSDPVAVGQSWEIPLQDLRDMLSPGGALPYGIPKKADKRIIRSLSTGVGAALQHAFGGSDVGHFRLTLQEIQEKEGRRLAVAAIDADFKLAADCTNVLTDWQTPEEREALGEFEEATVRLELSGPGTLVWDLDGNHVHSLDLEFDEHVNVRMVRPTVEGQKRRNSQPTGQMIELRGTFVSKLETTLVEPPAVPGPAGG